jgi:transcriptional regulator with XRE-family HTH domain
MAVDSGDRSTLGAALRTLRERMNPKLTVRAIAAEINISPANVSNFELDARLPPEEVLVRWLAVLGVSDDEGERLMSLRRMADGPGRLDAGIPSSGSPLIRLIEQEQIARHITEVSPLLIPGILQISDYARAILRRDPEVDARVTLRMGRRDILTRRNPVEFHALIDSEALVRPVAEPAVMLEQLRHLQVMAELPNIVIQLVSSTRSGYHPMLAGPFILVEYATAAPTVHLEHHRASATLWEPEDVRAYLDAAKMITDAAMSPEESSGLIAQLVNGMETA